MNSPQKLFEAVRQLAEQAFKDGAATGQKHAELLDQPAIDRLAEVYALELEINLGVAA